MSPPVGERCHGKLNLSLDVHGRRADGYHELVTVLHEVDLHDDLEARVVEASAGPRDVRLTIERAGGVAPADIPGGAANLAVRAARALLDEAGEDRSVALHLVKRLPAGAGVGGGSADAAGALRAVNRLLDLAASPEDLERVAARVGSDVPFQVRGGTALGRGRGERLEPVPAKAFRFRLIVPEFPLDTGDVYGALGSDTGRRRDPDAVLAALLDGDAAALAAACSNGLLEAAQRVEPRLAELRAEALAWWGGPVHLTGSGAALFVVDDGRSCPPQALPWTRAVLEIRSAAGCVSEGEPPRRG